jgi:hypothetical protein
MPRFLHAFLRWAAAESIGKVNASHTTYALDSNPYPYSAGRRSRSWETRRPSPPCSIALWMRTRPSARPPQSRCAPASRKPIRRSRGLSCTCATDTAASSLTRRRRRVAEAVAAEKEQRPRAALVETLEHVAPLADPRSRPAHSESRIPSPFRCRHPLVGPGLNRAGPRESSFIRVRPLISLDH